MAPLMAGSREHVVRSRDGGVAHRWGLLHSAPRQPQAPRPVDKPLLKHRAQAVNAFMPRCRPAFACEAEARQALTPFAPRLQATVVAQSTVRPISRSAKRGRPGHGTPPDPLGYPLEGARARRLAPRQAPIDHPRGCILAPQALDDPRFPPQDLCAGYNGHAHAERGCRVLNAPQCLAASRYLKKPARIMALLRVMPSCLGGYAALA
jgi:hypothetical protein